MLLELKLLYGLSISLLVSLFFLHRALSRERIEVKSPWFAWTYMYLFGRWKIFVVLLIVLVFPEHAYEKNERLLNHGILFWWVCPLDIISRNNNLPLFLANLACIMKAVCCSWTNSKDIKMWDLAAGVMDDIAEEHVRRDLCKRLSTEDALASETRLKRRLSIDYTD